MGLACHAIQRSGFVILVAFVFCVVLKIFSRWENNANVATREIAFVALLAQALTQRGLMNVEVTGFRGEVLSRLGRNPRNPGPYKGLKLYVTSGMIAESFCKKEPNSEARQLCVDKLVAPCDECMLQLASTGKSFLEVWIAFLFLGLCLTQIWLFLAFQDLPASFARSCRNASFCPNLRCRGCLRHQAVDLFRSFQRCRGRRGTLNNFYDPKEKKKKITTEFSKNYVAKFCLSTSHSHHNDQPQKHKQHTKNQKNQRPIIPLQRHFLEHFFLVLCLLLLLIDFLQMQTDFFPPKTFFRRFLSLSVRDANTAHLQGRNEMQESTEDENNKRSNDNEDKRNERNQNTKLHSEQVKSSTPPTKAQ